MKCQYVNCEKEAVVDCVSPQMVISLQDLESIDAQVLRRLVGRYIHYYCFDHCQSEGYCWNCGGHDEEILQFGLRRQGLCRVCRLDIKQE